MDKTIPSHFCTKTLKNGSSKAQILTYFKQTFFLYEQLFDFIKDHQSYYSKPQPLRHPLIFYFGHTATFFINKFIDSKIISQRINPYFQSIFAVGVDQMDWDDLNESHYIWPKVTEVRQYRNKVKMLVSEVINKSQSQIKWQSLMWIVLMGIQHQRIHLQTSAVIIRRLPTNELKVSDVFVDCPIYKTKKEQLTKNQLCIVPSFKQKWSRQRQTANTYGWDNQFGKKYIEVNQFKASKMLVSNGQYLQFIQDQGYQKLQYWDQQGKAWLKSKKVRMPIFWIKQNQKYFLKTINNIMQLPIDWPVEVNNLQASAFCKWKSKRQNIQLRLPTQDQYYAIRNIIKQDQPDWKYQSVGNINFQYWCSPNPVDMFKNGEFYDVIGNVWQLTCTPMHPFQDFQIHPIYQDFTTPTFDGKHFMIKGGSFISTGNQALYHSRYAFRRHFYQFAGFRYVQNSNKVQHPSLLVDQSDQKIQKFLKINYIQQQSYIECVLNVVKRIISNLKGNSLVVGCSVGRLVLQFSKLFQQSYGIDYTARFFQIASWIIEKGKYQLKNIKIKAEDLSFKSQKIHLYQMNPQNIDTNKLSNFCFVVIDCYTIKQQIIEKIIAKICPLMNKQAMLLILNIQNNKISINQLKLLCPSAELSENIKLPIKGSQTKQIELALYKL